MAGIWPLSFAQRHDLNGAPYPGALAYFYNAETDDPIDIYQDYSSAVAAGDAGKHPNPVEADGFGVFPGVYISGALSFYGFRMTTAAGVVLTPNSTIPNIGPAETEGEVVEPVSQFAIFKTGDLKARYDEGIHEGWLPANGRTAGSAASGADYVDDDVEALFLHLWAKHSGAGVVGGPGANAAADWAANKRIALPDMKGRSPVGLDDMDDDAGGVFPGLDTLGELLGGTVTLTAGQIPLLALEDGATDTESAFVINSPFTAGGESGGDFLGLSATNSGGPSLIATVPAHAHAVTGSVGEASPSAVSTTAPSMGVSWYIKK